MFSMYLRNDWTIEWMNEWISNALTLRRRKNNSSFHLAFEPVGLQDVNEKQMEKIKSFHFQIPVELNSYYFYNFCVKIFSSFSLKNYHYVIALQGFFCLSS